MREVFPFVAGAAIALLVQRISAPRLRFAALVGLAVVFGFVASLISGELAESWAFVLVDTAFVVVAALLTAGVIAVWQRRSTQIRH